MIEYREGNNDSSKLLRIIVVTSIHGDEVVTQILINARHGLQEAENKQESQDLFQLSLKHPRSQFFSSSRFESSTGVVCPSSALLCPIQADMSIAISHIIHSPCKTGHAITENKTQNNMVSDPLAHKPTLRSEVNATSLKAKSQTTEPYHNMRLGSFSNAAWY